ncbi:hypothetical protein B0O99DRAFT_598253 [Bisporella sp. PMI_857]|nr:hypothetical protein B0O99DRAFT_598253 [Bisporella sp. PMI_857]
MPVGSTIAGQFGVGKSLTDRAGEWPSLQPGAPWYCYVLADTAAFTAAKKVELPVPAGGWTEANTAEAIKAILPRHRGTRPESSVSACVATSMNFLFLSIC